MAGSYVSQASRTVVINNLVGNVESRAFYPIE